MTIEDRYSKRKPDGSMHYCNTIGVAVWYPQDEDKIDSEIISANWIIDIGYKNFRRHKLKMAKSGRPYFWKNRRRIYLDEVMRI